MTDFSANASALGYLFQLRYALLLLLENEESVVRLEALDDLDLSHANEPQKLFQLKHRAEGVVVSDGSPDLWKTIRVWATLVFEGKVSTSDMFVLVTTAKAATGSAASLLRNDKARDAAAAQKLLESAAASSKSKSLQPAFEAFSKLTASERLSLVSRIQVLDEEIDISGARARLEAKLSVAVARQFRVALANRVEGWWYSKCIEQLSKKIASISGFELFDQINSLALQFAPDALPLDFHLAVPSSEESATIASKIFVAQLNALNLEPKRIQYAILDYYRAYSQRSQWVREKLLIGDELERYEDRLHEEWDRMRLELESTLESPASELALVSMGKALLRWAEFEADIKIRPAVSAPYVMRGSFHILADGLSPRVWWHPDFLNRLESLLGANA